MSDRIDELSTSVQEGDVLIAATDGVLDNLFDVDLQACVSEQLTALMGDDPAEAQRATSLLAKSIAERAAAIGLKRGDESISTPFTKARKSPADLPRIAIPSLAFRGLLL